jgi:hypothetical protein
VSTRVDLRPLPAPCYATVTVGGTTGLITVRTDTGEVRAVKAVKGPTWTVGNTVLVVWPYPHGSLACAVGIIQ